MDVFCPRCDAAVPNVDEVILKRGKCPTCGGQLNLGGITKDLPISGAIAMSFNAGTRVAMPLNAKFKQTTLKDVGEKKNSSSDGPSDESTSMGNQTTPPPPPNDNSIDEEATEESLPSHSDFASSSSDEKTEDGDADLSLPSSPSMSFDLPSTPRDEERDTSETFSTAKTTVDSGTINNSSTESEESLKSTEEPSADGLHLQLPTIDFSMPSTGTDTDQEQDETSTSKEDSPSTPTESSESMPAHLQLPNFPDFQLPPIPGEEDDVVTGEFEIQGLAENTGSFGGETSDEFEVSVSEPTEDAIGEEVEPARKEQWSVASAEHAVVPPPLPENAPAPGTMESSDALPSLPALGLPNVKSQQKKHDPTLIQSEAAKALVAGLETKRSKWPYVLIGVFVLLLLGAGAMLATYGPTEIASWFGPKDPIVVKTKRDQAEEVLDKGNKAYKAGEQADTDKKTKSAKKLYKDAMRHFRQALKIDSALSVAHRNLGSALAKLGQPGKAVEHYDKYVKMSPKAKDVKDVQKIINDWETAQKKKKPKSRKR